MVGPIRTDVETMWRRKISLPLNYYHDETKKQLIFWGWAQLWRKIGVQSWIELHAMSIPLVLFMFYITFHMLFFFSFLPRHCIQLLKSLLLILQNDLIQYQIGFLVVNLIKYNFIYAYLFNFKKIQTYKKWAMILIS